MQFQRGDAIVSLSGGTVHLRLTLGGLAEISQTLEVAGPQALMGKLSTLGPASCISLLKILTRPSGACAAVPSDTDLVQILPALCEVFEHAFG